MLQPFQAGTAQLWKSVLARISHQPSTPSADSTSYRARDLRGDLNVFQHTVARRPAPRTRYAARSTLSLRSWWEMRASAASTACL